ncbi:MAG TPA: tripartite tricarboxylate transporter TctB family protein [Candidatus Binatia bacterium]|nr:tripartite tricarboxylate transporter TctB family protein [Candidatus Binatia bacterium]
MGGTIRAPRDFWAGVMFAGLGVAAVLLVRHHPMGSATRMGPAYFPLVLGGLLAVLGGVLALRALAVRGAPVGRLTLVPLAVITVATLLFGVLVRRTGVVPALVVLVVVSSWASRRFSWRTALALAGALAAFSVLVFVKLLGLPMPILGPGLGH